MAHAPEAKDSVLEVLFAIVLLDASIIGAAAVTLSTRQGWPVRPALFRRALL